MSESFTEKIKRLRPEMWDAFVRAVERERCEARMRREVELYGKPLKIYSIEEVKREVKAA